MTDQPTKSVRALGICSGGLDSILAGLVLRQQGIHVEWVCFETPFFPADKARKASQQTGISLHVQNITDEYLMMLKAPPAGYGKNKLNSEVAVRVPFIANCPGIVAKIGPCNELVDLTDVLPTLAELAGVQFPASYAVDGKSFASVLRGSDNKIHDYLFFEIGATRAVLKDGWKYLAFRLPETLPANPPLPYTHLADRPGGRGSEGPAKEFYPNYYDRDQLYNLTADTRTKQSLRYRITAGPRSRDAATASQSGRQGARFIRRIH